jgi:hypothetical protein
MRLQTLKFVREILQKKHDSLSKNLTTVPRVEILSIRSMITTIMNEDMTPASAQQLAQLGHRYNEALRLEKRQAAHWDEWKKEQQGISRDLMEIESLIEAQEPPSLFPAAVAGDGTIIPNGTQIPDHYSPPLSEVDHVSL